MLKGLDSVLPKTKAFAEKHNVDLAIPNCKGSGVGNAIVYTRLVEDFARFKGRPISIITGPLSPKVGVVPEEKPFALWENNPFVEKILDAYLIDEAEFIKVDLERKTLVQLNHVIENIGFAFGIRPRELRASLFLSEEEMRWALTQLRNLPRPLICLHPGGTSRSTAGNFWENRAWFAIVEELKHRAGFFQVGRPEFGDIDLHLNNPARTLRQTMALIWASDIFLGFDSTPMHIATAFNVPTIAIFDMEKKFLHEGKFSDTHIPSVMLRWSYPNNRNVAIMSNDQSMMAKKMVIDEITTKLDKLTYRF